MAAEPNFDHPVLQPSPDNMLLNGIGNNSIDEVSRAIQLDRSLLRDALITATFKGCVEITKYLLTTEKAPVEWLIPRTVARKASIELLDVVVSAGWDINQRAGSGKGVRLLDLVIWDEEMMKWCFEHGAQVADGAEDSFECPPLTESVAGAGSVSTFKLIRAQGARMGRKTLHRAALSAANCCTFAKPERMAMLRYLVEEEKLDVNFTDADAHCRTPISYAAEGNGDVDVVQYLLDKGADPTITFGYYTAFDLAQLDKNEDVVRVMKEWIEAQLAAG